MKIVIIGNGKIGSNLAALLVQEGHDITVVDCDETHLRKSQNTLDVMCIEGNGATAETQLEAGADKATLLIAATPYDEVNVLCCLIGKRLGTKKTISRVRMPEYYQQMHLIREDLGLSMVINPELSTAENILYMLRKDGKYSDLEARILDVALLIHAEHGGGNNSSFTTHVVTSSGTDTYSAIAAALGSLKGPKHGGANIRVCHMFADIKDNVKHWDDDDEVRAYLKKILNKDAFDHSGLIYGIGHAIYSKSDPRAGIFKTFVERLANEKGRSDEYNLYSSIERLAPEVIATQRSMFKGVSANVDFYSGFVYQMLGIPEELFTSLFAISRISGWSAHRMEELINGNKIIRPAYKAVLPRREYIPMNKR